MLRVILVIEFFTNFSTVNLVLSDAILTLPTTAISPKRLLTAVTVSIPPLGYAVVLGHGLAKLMFLDDSNNALCMLEWALPLEMMSSILGQSWPSFQHTEKYLFPFLTMAL